MGAHHVTAAGGRAWRVLLLLLAMKTMGSRLSERSIDVDVGASREVQGSAASARDF